MIPSTTSNRRAHHQRQSIVDCLVLRDPIPATPIQAKRFSEKKMKDTVVWFSKRNQDLNLSLSSDAFNSQVNDIGSQQVLKQLQILDDKHCQSFYWKDIRNVRDFANESIGYMVTAVCSQPYKTAYSWHYYTTIRNIVIWNGMIASPDISQLSQWPQMERKN